MAEKANGEYYYDAGTINEQLDDYEVYEQNGELHVNYKPTNNAVAFPELAMLLQSSRAAPSAGDLDAGESLLFVDSADEGLKVAYSNDGTDLVLNVLEADLTVA